MALEGTRSSIVHTLKRVISPSLLGYLRQIKTGRLGEDRTLEAITADMNINGSALYNLLVVYRCLRRYAEWAGESFMGRTVLEFGTSKDPGLPMIMLLAGCHMYVGNNIFPLDRKLSEAYVKLVYLIMSSLDDVDASRLEEIVDWVEGSQGGRQAILRSNLYKDMAPVPSEDLDLPEGSIDVNFSISVLEHVKRPREVLANSYRILKPGGWCCHTIDLRDHRDFSRPLDFLKYDEQEYKARGGTDNRLRASEFLAIFRDLGFSIKDARFRAQPFDLTSSGATDVSSSYLKPFDHLTPYRSMDEIEPWVTESMRQSFHAKFRQQSLKDLSTQVMVVVCHKPHS